jgi:hypothetical protein
MMGLRHIHALIHGFLINQTLGLRHACVPENVGVNKKFVNQKWYSQQK